MIKNQKVRFISHASLIAASYIVLTMLTSLFGLSSGAIQCRLSEALCILPYFTSAAIPGLSVGCLIANIFTPGTNIFDVIFGTLATTLGALGTYYLSKICKKAKWVCSIPPILANALIVPFVLKYAYFLGDSIVFLMLTVGAGEVISVGILGNVLLYALVPYQNKIFTQNK